MQKILKLTLLVILSIMLTNCSLLPIFKEENKVSSIVVTTKIVRPNIPKEYLSPTDAPSSDLLKKVRVAEGKENLLVYLKELYDAWFQNSIKINSISSLLEANATGTKND